MSNRLVSVLLASALIAVPAAALAQSQPAQAPQPAPAKPAENTSVAPITVEAAPKPKVIQQQSHLFVEKFAAAPNAEVDQIGRWRDPVCVQVEGLVPAQGGLVKARIEEVAQAVGLPKARAACSANVEIVFTDKPQALMDSVSKRREALLGYYHRHDHDKLKVVTRPIQAWYVTATQGGGDNNAGALFAFGGQGGGPVIPVQVEREVVDDPDNRPPTGCGINHNFTSCLQSVFRNVFVVVDTNRVKGQDLGLITDYIVMVALAQPNSLDGCNALPSVIDLMAPHGCPGRDTPDGLTATDAAYLTALYSSDLEARKTGQQGDISGRMAKILTKATNGGR
jgi:hypothetical protein